MELNPILTRESRARWRKQAFWLLFGGVALFALFMYFCYAGTTDTASLNNNGRVASTPTPTNEVGATLFILLTYFQLIGWMLLSPFLTATAIAAEREQGMLEGLQLSQMTPGAIVRGKLYSSLTFAALLHLSLLPIQALCFLLGGVSPGEFLAAGGQIFIAALLGTSIGLFVSSRSRRAAEAVRTTMGLVGLWLFGSYLCLLFTIFPLISTVARRIAAELILLNPVYTFTLWQGGLPGFLPTPPVRWGFDAWLFGCLLQGALSLILLWLCVASVRRPFDEQYWVEIGPQTDVRELTDKQARRESQTGQIIKPRPMRARWEVPLARHIRLANPIMQRDLRAKLIFRRVALRVIIGQCFLMFLAAGLYSWLLWTAFTTFHSMDTIWFALTAAFLLVLILAPAVTGAGAFTREREAGTWQSIRLSLLSPLEILSGKFISVFAIAPLLSLILLPFLAAHLYAASMGIERLKNWQIVLTFALLFSTAWATAAWGLFISSGAKKTSSATGKMLGCLFAVLLVAPILMPFLYHDVLGYRRYAGQMDLIWSLHPFGAFSSLTNEFNISRGIENTMGGCLFLFLFGCAHLGLVARRLNKNTEQDL